MNVYVVSAVWDHVGAMVIGAATDRASAESIAERYPDDDPWVKSWAPWRERIGAEGSCTWERVALLPDGTVHPSLSQEIVCVPLAGFIGDWPIKGLTTEGLATAVPALMKPKIDGDRHPLDAMREAMEAVLAARAAAERAGGYVDRISVGAGAGLDYFQRAASSLSKPPGIPWKVFDGDSIAGLRIVVDPDMRPDQIKIGSVIYTIGTGDNGIPEGTMIRVDMREIDATWT